MTKPRHPAKDLLDELQSINELLGGEPAPKQAQDEAEEVSTAAPANDPLLLDLDHIFDAPDIYEPGELDGAEISEELAALDTTDLIERLLDHLLDEVEQGLYEHLESLDRAQLERLAMKYLP